MPKQPYIGITGITTAEETEEILKYSEQFKNSHYKIMLGVLAKGNSLRNDAPKFPARYPLLAENIFPNTNSVLRLIHFATDRPWHLSEELQYCKCLLGFSIDGFQLNVTWPSVDSILRYEGRFKGEAMVLQVGPKALDVIQRDKAFGPT